jgi:FkbM family methyltransferase
VVSAAYARFLYRLRPGLLLRWDDSNYNRSQAKVSEIVHDGAQGPIAMTFHIPNAVCRYRAETFSIKEPETLEWIGQYGGSGAFFDIGANVGLYSVYYAKVHGDQVYAFEPSVLNLALLAKNISVNDLSGRVVIIPNPLTSANQVAAFHMSSLEEGGALSTFGAEFGHDGQPLAPLMSYETTGFSLDYLVSSGVITANPGIIKIDVDGIEHFILRGARATLSRSSLRSILIEVNEDFRELAEEVNEILVSAGFVMSERRHADMFESSAYSTTFNQIWVRP